MDCQRRFSLILVFSFIVLSSVTAQQKSFAFVFLNTNPDKVELPKDIVDTLQARHMRNLTRLADEGKLIAAGPFYDGGGIFVFGDHPVDSVWAWLKTDPAVRAQRWIIEVLRYTPLKGSICKAPKDYTMTTYGYVRVSGVKKGEEAGALSAVMGSVSKQDTLFAAGYFPDSGGGIMLFRNAPTDSSVSATWTMGEAKTTLNARKLYIAKGSFCEE